jgi:hypothetical protein
MRLTDWLMLLRQRPAWPPKSTGSRFPVHTTISGRPSSDGRGGGDHPGRSAPWRYRIPTRRLPAAVHRALKPQPLS